MALISLEKVCIRQEMLLSQVYVCLISFFRFPIGQSCWNRAHSYSGSAYAHAAADHPGVQQEHSKESCLSYQDSSIDPEPSHASWVR